MERISVGGMAEVFRAKPMDAPGFEKFLAIKRILPNLAEDSEFIDMFIDEAKIAVQLNHRNICQIYELGRLNDSHYIVMEFISGRDILAIQNRLRRERRIMSVGMAAYLTRQIASGLDAAHRKTSESGSPLNIIHRDISPQNVLVSYAGEVKVIDFGIAKAATRTNKTQVGVLKGKFGYMSPEQVRGLALDRRSDIFALGTLFHEMLTCRRLFHGESDFATLEKVRKADVPPPSKLNPNVPPEIDHIVSRALQADVEDRYQWCSEMADELDNFLSKLRPPYTERTLTNWMQRTFAEELEKERQKRQVFARFQRPEDVLAHNEQQRQELAAKMGLAEGYDGSDDDQIAAQATQIFDPEAGLDALMGLGANSIDSDSTMQDIDLPGLAELHTRIATIDLSGPDQASSSAPEVSDDLLPPPGLMPPAGATQIGVPQGYPQPNMTGLYPNAPMQPPPNSTARLGIILVGTFVLLSVAIVAMVVYLFFFSGMAQPPQTTGQLTVRTAPIQEVEVKLNGELLATRTPVMRSDLAPGRYTLEVRHDGYKPATRLVTVEAGARESVFLTLVPVEVGKGIVSISVTPPEAELYVDGELVSGSGTSRFVELSERGEHLIEARSPGYYVEEFQIGVKADQKVSKTLKLRKITGEISLESSIPGKVYIDGVASGMTPMALKDLDPVKSYELGIRAPGHHPWKKTVVFFQSYEKNFKARLRPASGKAAPDDPVKFGYLTVNSGPTWWRVVIDGWDSGMTTPISSKGRLTLPVGAHTVTLVRGEQKHDIEVTIDEGRTTRVERSLKFKMP